MKIIARALESHIMDSLDHQHRVKPKSKNHTLKVLCQSKAYTTYVFHYKYLCVIMRWDYEESYINLFLPYWIDVECKIEIKVKIFSVRFGLKILLNVEV